MIFRILWVLFYSSWLFTIAYCGKKEDWGQYTRICFYFLMSLYFFVYVSWFFEGVWYFPYGEDFPWVGGIV